MECLTFDYFGIITYVTDYYMKDDSGTLKLIEKVLKNATNESYKKQLQLVKNIFLTHRQIGESEAYYKLFPSLHLSDSNIGVVFIPTGFRQNRSRFLQQISEEEARVATNVVEVEDKEGKYYVEKTTWMDKYLGRPKCMQKLTYSQFVKRYGHTKSPPQKYVDDDEYFKNEIKEALTKTDIDNEDYFFDGVIPKVGESEKRLPKYFPAGDNWLQLRRPLALRLHKFKRTTNPHEFYYSELQLYTTFNDEDDLFPNDIQACSDLYDEKKDVLLNIKGQVMKHLASVEEAREHAEEILANEVGDKLDPTKEQENEEAILDGVIEEHPELNILDPKEFLENELIDTQQQIFRKTELLNDEEIKDKILKMDKEQILVIDIGTN